MVTRAWANVVRNVDAAAVIVLCALAMACWWPRLTGPIDLRWDGGAYYILGTALAQGKGYRLMSEPGDPRSTLHPPLLPAVIAAHQAALGTSDVMVVGPRLRQFAFGVFLAYGVAIYALLRTGLPTGLAFLGTAMCLLNDRACFLSDLCFPEIPYALASVGCVLASRRIGGPLGEAVAFLCALAAYALRTVGIALLAAWVAESLLNRRFRTAALRLVAAAVPVACWHSYVYWVENGPEYARPAYAYQRAGYMYYNVSYAKNIVFNDPLTLERGRARAVDLASRFVSNLERMPASVGEAVTSSRQLWGEQLSTMFHALPEVWAPKWIGGVIVTALAALVIVGLAVLLWRRELLVPLYSAAYVALVCSTPWPKQFGRYLIPLAPFLVLGLFTGLRAVDRWLRRVLPGLGHGAFRTLVVALLVLGVVQQVDALHRMFRDSLSMVIVHAGRGSGYRLFFYDNYRDLDRGLSWLNATDPGREVVAASDPFWVSLHTGRDAVLPPLEIDSGKAQALLDSVPVRYLILDADFPEVRRYAERVVGSHPTLWRQVFSTPSGRVQIHERRPASGDSEREPGDHGPSATAPTRRQ